MIVNNREECLLQSDDGVVLLIDRRQCIVLVHSIVGQRSEHHIAEERIPRNAFQPYISLAQDSVGELRNTVWLRWFGVAHHIHAVHLH